MKQLLVAIDFSDVSQKVFEVGLQMARALDAEVYLIYVEDPKPIFVGHEVDTQVERDTLALQMREHHGRLQEMAQTAGRGSVKVSPLMVQGPTVQKILEEAQRLNVSLIVMGTHGHGALYQTLAGSVSCGVLRKAPCPVVMVPANSQPPGQ